MVLKFLATKGLGLLGKKRLKTISSVPPKIATTPAEKISRDMKKLARTIEARSKKTRDDVSMATSEFKKKLDKK